MYEHFKTSNWGSKALKSWFMESKSIIAFVILEGLFHWRAIFGKYLGFELENQSIHQWFQHIHY